MLTAILLIVLLQLLVQSINMVLMMLVGRVVVKIFEKQAGEPPNEGRI